MIGLKIVQKENEYCYKIRKRILGFFWVTLVVKKGSGDIGPVMDEAINEVKKRIDEERK